MRSRMIQPHGPRDVVTSPSLIVPQMTFNSTYVIWAQASSWAYPNIVLLKPWSSFSFLKFTDTLSPKLSFCDLLCQLWYQHFFVSSKLPLLARINDIQIKHHWLFNLIHNRPNGSYYILPPFVHDNTKAFTGLYKCMSNGITFSSDSSHISIWARAFTYTLLQPLRGPHCTFIHHGNLTEDQPYHQTPNQA